MIVKDNSYVVLPVIELSHQMISPPEFIYDFNHFVLCGQGGSSKVMRSQDFYNLTNDDILNVAEDGYIMILPNENMFINEDIIIGIHSSLFWSNGIVVGIEHGISGIKKLYIDKEGNPVIHISSSSHFKGDYSAYKGCKVLNGSIVKNCSRQQALRSSI